MNNLPSPARRKTTENAQPLPRPHCDAPLGAATALAGASSANVSIQPWVNVPRRSKRFFPGLPLVGGGWSDGSFRACAHLVSCLAHILLLW